LKLEIDDRERRAIERAHATDVRIFDEDGRRRRPADLCRLAADEVAMLPDESGLSF
jgi:hypothetical protein